MTSYMVQDSKNLPVGLWTQLTGEWKYARKEFSLDLFQTTMENLYGKPTYTQMLMWKLNSIRRQIAYDEMWCVPTLEEAKAGYEIEIQTSWGWIKGIYPVVTWADTHVNLFSGAKTDEERFRAGTYRMKREHRLKFEAFRDLEVL